MNGSNLEYSNQLQIEQVRTSDTYNRLCHEFIHSNSVLKYVLGTTKYAAEISASITIDGFIDDFADFSEFHGKPVVRLESVPHTAIVLSTVFGVKPLMAEKRLRQYQFKVIDYFTFLKYSGLKLNGIDYWKNFEAEFEKYREKYNWIYRLLGDYVSKNQFYNLINFRLSYDLYYMRGFSLQEHEQYFEELLGLGQNEVFVDVGGFDGATTLEFIKHAPNYSKILFFEPEEKNLLVAKEKLKSQDRIEYYQLGLSNSKQILKFKSSGSSSKVTEEGDLTIQVDKLDDIIAEKITFIKMDIEGGEQAAIEGAQKTILKWHPKLAICVYHDVNDFWKIPEQILSIRSDYKIYLRHYTEGITETVMFFIPN